MDSIERCLFFSSNGPSITDIRVEGEEIVVESSQARSISFIANTALGIKYTAEKGTIKEASYTLKGQENYVRVEVTDELGRRAWSNPLYVER